MTDCPRIGRWIGGCNWEGRYDKGPTQFRGSIQGNIGDFLEAYRQVTYVRDICATCGKTIERQK